MKTENVEGKATTTLRFLPPRVTAVEFDLDTASFTSKLVASKQASKHVRNSRKKKQKERIKNQLSSSLLKPKLNSSIRDGKKLDESAAE